MPVLPGIDQLFELTVTNPKMIQMTPRGTPTTVMQERTPKPMQKRPKSFFMRLYCSNDINQMLTERLAECSKAVSKQLRH